MYLANQCKAESSCFPDTLRYISPAHGGWGVVRMGMLVPESYQLFVCPFACGRHGALGALAQGLKNRLSYLYIDECDIVFGSYEQHIIKAVEELLNAIGYRPKVLMIFVSCIDDLLGTDHEAFLETLRHQYKDMRFTVCHMNPISLNTKCPPPVNIQRKIFGLLEKPSGCEAGRKQSSLLACASEAVKAVAFIGNNVKIDRESEIYSVLKAAGYSNAYHISDFKTFEDFQKMSGASLNIVISPIGVLAAQDIKERLGIDYVYVPVNYDFEGIDENYRSILKISGAELDLTNSKKRTQEALLDTKSLIGDIPVIIDSSATIRPFTLARFLYQNGFNVTEVYAQECIPLEKNSFRWICDHALNIKVLQPEHPANPMVRQIESNCLAIGFEAAYIKGARYVVDLVNDETLYGYHGIEKLMKMMRASLNQKADLFDMIHKYGMVI